MLLYSITALLNALNASVCHHCPENTQNLSKMGTVLGILNCVARFIPHLYHPF